MLYAKGGQAYIPSGKLRKILLKEAHDSLWASHPDIEQTKSVLVKQFYWPCMEDDIEAYVRTCLVCQQDKVERMKQPSLL